MSAGEDISGCREFCLAENAPFSSFLGLRPATLPGFKAYTVVCSVD